MQQQLEPATEMVGNKVEELQYALIPDALDGIRSFTIITLCFIGKTARQRCLGVP